MDKIEALFHDWDMPMVRACIQGHMGRVAVLGEDSAMASIGDFCFFAGRPLPELVAQADAPILVPGDGDWVRLIQGTLGEGAVPFTRYATRCAPQELDCDRLIGFTRALPRRFELQPIGRGHYFTLMEEEWSRDLCGCFRDATDFLEQGLGLVVTEGERIVAGASSYAACDGAIEIEIDTRPDRRRLGLASACAARLILECLARKIYPGWDAHDRRSLALAEKLGYQLDRPYTAFWVEEKVRLEKDRSIN